MEEVTVWQLIWTFLNSPFGISLVGAVVLWILARIFKAKPEWEKIYHEHSGLLVDAVKYAEKRIPDNSPNKAAARADAALKYVLKVESRLAKKEGDLKTAIALAHVDVEEKAKKANGG